MKTSELLFFPNPVRENLYFKSGNDIRSVEIVDLSGRVILQQALVSDGQTLSVAHMKPGMYVVKITMADNRTVVNKLLKN